MIDITIRIQATDAISAIKEIAALSNSAEKETTSIEKIGCALNDNNYRIIGGVLYYREPYSKHFRQISSLDEVVKLHNEPGHLA